MDLRPLCWRWQTDLASSHLNVWPGTLDGPASFLFSLHCVSQRFLWAGYNLPSQGMEQQPPTKAAEDIFAFPAGGRGVTDVAVSEPRAGSHLCLCP